MSSIACDVFALEEDLAEVRLVKHGNAVENARFPGSVWSYESQDLAVGDMARDIRESSVAPEVQRDPFYFKQFHAFHANFFFG